MALQFKITTQTCAANTADVSFRTDSNGWLEGEKEVCLNYYDSLQKINSKAIQYAIREEYLRLSGEQGHTPTPWYITVLTIALILFEAAGFGYVLGGRAMPDASANTFVFVAWGIAILFAIGLAWATHYWAGPAIYRNKVLQGIYDNVGENEIKKFQTVSIDFNNNDADKNHNDSLRKFNRFGFNKSDTPKNTYQIPTAQWAFAGVVVLAVVIFAVRVYVYQDTAKQETKNPSSYYQSQQSPSLPPALSSPKAEEVQTLNDAGSMASYLTYGALTIIYLAIQGVSVWAGSKEQWNLRAAKSKEAYDYIEKEKCKDIEELKQREKAERISIETEANKCLAEFRKRIQKLADEKEAEIAKYQSMSEGDIGKREAIKNQLRPCLDALASLSERTFKVYIKTYGEAI